MNSPHADADAEFHARASALFLKLRDLAPAEREAALVAADDEALCAEVRAWLAHDAPDGPDGPDGPDATNLGRTPFRALPLELPERIGPYRVLGPLGRGGSGQVFLAEQLEPVRRRVALKVVPAAAHSPELAARFEVERRALERAEHPNVARILDAGRTDAGLPYLVLDYVEGPTITAYCRREGLSLTGSLRLLLPVVDAVQHAHQRGVVHRDLKPGNVLVAEIDGRPSPRVLDFGIAKPIQELFEGDAPATLGLPLGTPAYMAPEQTGAGGVDTRSDVYALGALAYEIVTGQPPIDASGDPLAVLRRVRETIPEPASRARARHPELGRQGAPRAFFADLDLVLAKALEKDPDRRYPTAAAFGADLERVLTRSTVEARAPSVLYRAARFVERNRALSAAGLVGLIAVGVGVGGLALGLREARAQRTQALFQRDTEYGLNRFLIDDILLAASPDRAGAGATAIELVQRASGTVDARFAGKPLIAAALHQALADTLGELGEFDQAEHHIARALELRRAVAGTSARETVRSEIAQASLLARRERYTDALEPLTRALARARLILGPDEVDTYTAENDLALTLLALGRAREALPLIEEALAGRERLLGPNDRQVFLSLANLSLVLEEAGDVPRAVRVLEEALERAESVPDPPLSTVLGLNNNLGALLQDLGRSLEAVPYLERAATLATERLGPDHPDTLTIRSNQASLESEFGDREHAITLFREVAERTAARLGPDAESSLQARHGLWSTVRKAGHAREAADGFLGLLEDVLTSPGAHGRLEAQTRASLAFTLLELGLAEEAASHAERAVLGLTAIYGADHPRVVNARATLERARAALGVKSD